MPSQRELIQTVESHTRSLVTSVAHLRFWHSRYLEWAEQQKARRIAQAQAERDAALAAAQAQYEATVRQAEAEHQARMAELETWQSQALAEARAHYEQTVAQAEQDYAQATAAAEAEYRQAMDALQRDYEETVARAEGEHRAKISEEEQRHEQTLTEAAQAYDASLVGLQQRLQAVVLAGGFSLAAFDDPAWLAFKPTFGNHRPVSVARIGLLREPGPWGDWAMPASLPLIGGQNVLLKFRGPGRASAVHAAQSLLLRLLASIPPGKLRFIFVDPVGLGQNAAPFMHFADYDEQLVTARAWTEPQHIEQRLSDLTGHMENVIQQYLRNQYATIEDYNAQAGEIAEPYRVLVVFDFPTNFSEQAARRLSSIAQNGPRCGVYTVVLADTDKVKATGRAYGGEADGSPIQLALADLEQASTIIAWKKDRWVWHDEDFKDCTLELDTPPETELFNRSVTAVGEAARDAGRVEVPFERIAPPGSQWWAAGSADGIRVPLGPAGARKVQELALGRGTAQHALVAGKTGSGKSTLLHTLITNLALAYSPEEMELYLIDFKKGVEFKTYAAHELPHARVVAIESEREFGLSVLQGLDAELKHRGDLFRRSGVDHIADYRAKALTSAPRPGGHPPSPLPNLGEGKGGRGDEVRVLPRILLIVDEFQEFFTEDDPIASQAAQILDRLVRQGRAFGIHVLLGSQTLSGAYTLARSTVDQMAVRIALQCSEADSRLILADDNPAARLLSRPGEAIYNDANGLVEGNSRFQVAWLPDEQRDRYLQQVQELARQKGYRPPRPQIVFEGNAPAEVEKNRLLHDLLTTPFQPSSYQGEGRVGVHKTLAWLGEPVAIADPVAASFRRQSGSNLLIVGQNDESALGMMAVALISLAAQLPSPDVGRGAGGEGAGFYVLDFGAVDAPYAGLWDTLAEILPHTVKVGRRRQLPDIIGELASEVQQRLDNEQPGTPSRYLFLYGLQRARDLRQEEMGLGGFSSFGEEPAAPNPAQQFTTILREGPDLGIHTLVWCDTVTNLNRSLDRRALREFAMRVVFQMSAEDSANLIDTPAASKLGPYRALFYDEEEGRLDKFRPYGLPATAWLEQVKGWLAGRQ